MRHIVCCMLIVLSVGSSVAHALELLTEENPPHNMQAGTNIEGVATDKLREVLKRTHSHAAIKIMKWSRAYQAAVDKPGTCVFSTARTPKREKLFQWVGPLATTEWVIYKRTDNPIQITTLNTLRNEPIGGYLQDVIATWLFERGFRVVAEPKDQDNPQKLMKGELKYWATTRPRATALLADQGLEKEIVPTLTFGKTDLYLACNKGTSKKTVANWNKALKQMQKDGTSAIIEERYKTWRPTVQNTQQSGT